MISGAVSTSAQGHGRTFRAENELRAESAQESPVPRSKQLEEMVAGLLTETAPHESSLSVQKRIAWLCKTATNDGTQRPGTGRVRVSVPELRRHSCSWPWRLAENCPETEEERVQGTRACKYRGFLWSSCHLVGFTLRGRVCTSK